ncbi:hypothetical protein PQX77_018777 [Marasmius sp. AFHP31]|nr:hypothetical protein PQX77_018777 [Marasmius sp. AFHP31]
MPLPLLQRRDASQQALCPQIFAIPADQAPVVDLVQDPWEKVMKAVDKHGDATVDDLVALSGSGVELNDVNGSGVAINRSAPELSGSRAERAVGNATTVKGWKEDIDTLLVFVRLLRDIPLFHKRFYSPESQAGLFSAVVTAKAVKLYEWLSEDLQDVSASVLYRISQQLNNPNMPPGVPTDSPFHPTTSVIQVDSLWFLSLVMSLASGLFGLMCKQWLREHRRDTPNITHMEALGLRQLRHESLKKWGIHLFPGALS